MTFDSFKVPFLVGEVTIVDVDINKIPHTEVREILNGGGVSYYGYGWECCRGSYSWTDAAKFAESEGNTKVFVEYLS